MFDESLLLIIFFIYLESQVIYFYTRTLFITQVSIQALLIVLFLLTSSYADSTPEPQRLMEETSKTMIKAFMMETDAIRKDPQIAHDLIRGSLVPKINFKLMSRWVLGSNWKAASTHQKHEFIKEFKELVIKFYSKGLIQYLSENDLQEDLISFRPFRGKLDSKYVTIRSLVHPPKGGEPPIKVNYEMYHNKAGKWQVYDVSIEGISLVTSYRSSFKQIIKQKGMDALLSELRAKNSKLSQAKV